MTQKTNNIFSDESFLKTPKNDYSTNKTDVYIFDDIWGLIILDSKDCSPESKRSYSLIWLWLINSGSLECRFF